MNGLVIERFCQLGDRRGADPPQRLGHGFEDDHVLVAGRTEEGADGSPGIRAEGRQSVGGGPANSTTPLILLSYKEAFQRFNIGYGTSLAIISMVLMLALGAVYLRMQRREGVYE